MIRKFIFITIAFLFFLSPSVWARDLDEILRSGYITFGIRKVSITIYQGEDHPNPGFCYEVAKSFAQDLGVEPKFHIVSKFSDYWKKDGVFLLKTKPLKIETPDIYNKVDVVSDIITLTAQRQKLVNMVPFIENTEIFFGRRDLHVRKYKDLKGLRIFTYEGMSFYNIIKEGLKRKGIPYVINYVDINNDTGELNYIGEKKNVNSDEVELLVVPSNRVIRKFASYHQILLEHADISLQDSFSFFLHYYENSCFRDGLKPLFPSGEKVGYLSFCTSYKTPKLNERLKEFMESFRKSREFDNLIERYMGISYKEYKDLLYMEEK